MLPIASPFPMHTGPPAIASALVAGHRVADIGDSGQGPAAGTRMLLEKPAGWAADGDPWRRGTRPLPALARPCQRARHHPGRAAEEMRKHGGVVPRVGRPGRRCPCWAHAAICCECRTSGLLEGFGEGRRLRLIHCNPMSAPMLCAPNHALACRASWASWRCFTWLPSTPSRRLPPPDDRTMRCPSGIHV